MALSPQALYQDLISARSSGPFPFNGPGFNNLALAISYGVYTWGAGQPSNLALTGLASGTSGAGVINPAASTLFVPVNIQVVREGLKSAGLEGPLSESLAVVLAVGVSTTFSTQGQYAGTAVGVGVGVDVSSVSVSNAGTLIPILLGFMTSLMGSGAATPDMARGISLGVADLLKGGTGTGTVTGVSSPYPGSGPTTSVVV